MYKRKGCIVRGHYRNNTWINQHNRSSTLVNDIAQNSNNTASSIHKLKERFPWLFKKQSSFHTNCWVCGADTFLYRNDNGTCVLFDKLGKPWPIHPCWQEYKEEKDHVINQIIENKSEQLNSAKVNDYTFGEAFPDDYIECHLVGIDRYSKIIVNQTKNNSSFYFRHVIYLTEFGYLDLVVPEDNIYFFANKMHVYIKLKNVNRKGRLLFTISELKINKNSKNLYISNNNELENCSKKNWTVQQLFLNDDKLLMQHTKKHSHLRIKEILQKIEKFLIKLSNFIPKLQKLPSERKINILCLIIFMRHWHILEKSFLEPPLIINKKYKVQESNIIQKLRSLGITEKGLSFFFKEKNEIIISVQKVKNINFIYE